MKYEIRQELNRLSKECFGTASKWQKLVYNGESEAFQREREVMIPKKDGRGFDKKVYTDTKYVVKHYSVEEVKKVMLDILESRKSKTTTEPAKENDQK